MSRPYKRKLSNLLINRTYQLRYTFALLTICCIILAIMGSYWYQEVQVAMEVLEVEVIATMREGDAQRLHQEMAQERLQGLMVMAGGALLLCLVVVVFMIVLTHGIAGPLHFIKQQMGRIRDGKLGDLRPLRKGDGLSEFYETFRDMAGSLREDAAEDIKQVDLALSRAEALAGESDADKELLEILNRLKARKVALLEKS